MTLHAQLMLTNANAKSIGTYGEMIAHSFIEEAGYFVQKPAAKKQGDLLAIHPIVGRPTRIEVKLARAKLRTLRGCKNETLYFNFCLKRDGVKNKRNLMTDCAYSDYVLLICLLPSGYTVKFLIPVRELNGQKSITIYGHPDDYDKSFAKYRLTEGSVIRL